MLHPLLTHRSPSGSLPVYAALTAAPISRQRLQLKSSWQGSGGQEKEVAGTIDKKTEEDALSPPRVQRSRRGACSQCHPHSSARTAVSVS